MTSLTTTPQSTSIVYPSSDGELVAETYVHFYALLVTLEVLRQYLAGRQATVLANQFLYYAQGFPKLRVAPDVMVIFDVAPGGRDNYKIWEEGQVPSVIFELTSEGTREQDKIFKKTLYEQLGVQEYWLFDPKGEWIEGQLQGYRLRGDVYEPITDGRSEPLQLRLQPEGQFLTFYREDTGEKLLAPEELAQALAQSQTQIEAERLKAEQESQRADRLAAKLRALGIDPEAE
ncbi:MAG: Uma2 family endonuclease [Trichocoleus desertorum ATA4-8-CV12]|jgi:Uma2 family endonuclease|nr:Uma2 family endonuclease [Trichocoleus desertorum ATA4-8-CV12]